MSKTRERPEAPPKLPEKKIGPFAAGVGVAIWINEVETDGGSRKIRSITINPRRYFDAESNQWKDAPSFRPSDLPALLFALTKAQDYCYTQPLPDDAEAEQNSNGHAAAASPF